MARRIGGPARFNVLNDLGGDVWAMRPPWWSMPEATQAAVRWRVGQVRLHIPTSLRKCSTVLRTNALGFWFASANA